MLKKDSYKSKNLYLPHNVIVAHRFIIDMLVAVRATSNSDQFASQGLFLAFVTFASVASAFVKFVLRSFACLGPYPSRLDHPLASTSAFILLRALHLTFPITIPPKVIMQDLLVEFLPVVGLRPLEFLVDCLLPYMLFF